MGAPRIAASVSNMEAQAILIASGRFLGFLPTHYARPWVASGEMRAIDHLGIEWRSPFFLATRVSPQPPQIVRVFRDDMVAAMGSAGSRRRDEDRFVATEKLQETYGKPTPAAAALAAVGGPSPSGSP